jgi:hypothetical protein
MTELSDATTEETGAVTVPLDVVKRPRAAIRGGLKKLTEKDATSPAVVGFLLEDIDRLELENRRLAEFREKFHEKDKEAAIRTTEVTNWQRGDVLYTICIAIGSAFLGGAPSFDKSTKFFMLIACAILIVGALLFRFFRFEKGK